MNAGTYHVIETFDQGRAFLATIDNGQLLAFGKKEDADAVLAQWQSRYPNATVKPAKITVEAE